MSSPVLIALVWLMTSGAGAGRAPNPKIPSPVWPHVIEAYAGIHDYVAAYEKEERAIDHGSKQNIRLSFRKPLDVRLEWLDDRGRIDQIAVYRQGRNDGRMLVRRPGFLGRMLGTLRLEIDGTTARADSQHPITNIGVGYMIQRVTDQAKAGELAIIEAGDGVLDGVTHDQIEIVSTGAVSLASVPTARSARLWIDRVSRLPVRIDVLDAGGVLLERHRFKSVQLNVGLADSVFTL